mmetsp:Transcript_1105/g.1447  ORF Transcript_1105/g.1447 Transcript_1105/m.1447 type:complete len:336 (+) Transcript_1105:91-1098(+)
MKRRQLLVREDSVVALIRKDNERLQARTDAVIAKDQDLTSAGGDGVEEAHHPVENTEEKPEHCEQKQQEEDLLDFKSNHSHICSISIDEEDYSDLLSDEEDYDDEFGGDESSHGMSSRLEELDEEIRTFQLSIPESLFSAVPKEDEGNRVRFDKAIIHYHQMILGDNPGCSTGVPLTLDWECIGTSVHDIKKEAQQQEASTTSRDGGMHLPATARYIMMKSDGYSSKELYAMTVQVRRARQQRRITLENLHLQPREEIFERIAKPFKKYILTSPKERKKQICLKQWKTGRYVATTDKKNCHGRSGDNLSHITECSALTDSVDHLNYKAEEIPSAA